MMSIKPDHWIRRMALETKMIDPFEEKLVRQGVISYGLSSFGYDIRVADEFLIFTTATGQLTVVDPKSIDEKAMIHHRGDVCIIPPNSFALARSVEYFRMPRNVLGLCLGKSTYARCFRGDTRVALAKRKAATLESLANEYQRSGTTSSGYGVSREGLIKLVTLDVPRWVAKETVLEVELDNGKKIQCTRDHKFVTRYKGEIEAQHLLVGDSLFPLYRKAYRGYEAVYQPILGKMHSTHRLADEWNLSHRRYEDVATMHRHHIDSDRQHNFPTNNTSAWAGDQERRQNQSELAKRLFTQHNFTEIDLVNALKEQGTLRGAARLLGCDRAVFRRFSHVIEAFKSGNLERNNHKVVAIREIKGEVDVFCLTSPETGNFALEAGVFVNNCGIITNFTPFEPGWEGHVTIEISNTTPLPAKIYANEGIAQVLFFEGEEPEVTYADRQGKYQAQTGITLPRL